MSNLKKIGSQILSLVKYLGDDQLTLSDFRKRARTVDLSIIEEMAVTAKVPHLTAITVHVFYQDFVPLLRNKLESWPAGTPVFISTPFDYIKKDIEDTLAPMSFSLDVRICRNRGRNFAPLFVEFSKELLKFDSFVHIHSKKSLHSKTSLGDNWSIRSIDAVLNPSKAIRLAQIANLNPSIGLGYADSSDLIRGINFRWGVNTNKLFDLMSDLRYVKEVRKRGPIVFPAGGMFWAKTEALRELLEFHWTYEMFPEEKGQLDGTLQHGLERLIGEYALAKGFSHAIYVPGRDLFLLEGTYKDRAEIH